MIVIGVTAISIVVFTSFSFLSYSRQRTEHFAAATAEGQRALLSLVDRSTRLFDGADSYIRVVREFYLRHGGGEELRRFIEATRAQHSEKFSGVISINDRNGDLAFSTQRLSGATINSAGIEHFKFFRADPRDAVYVDPTRKGVVSQQYQFRVVRPVLRDGQFDGDILQALLPRDFVDFFEQFHLGPNSVLTMITLDHRLIARYPAPPDELYNKPIDNFAIWGHLAKAPAGAYRAASPIDGIARHHLYQKLDGYPVVVSLGIADRDIIAGMSAAWTGDVVQSLVFASVASLFCALVLQVLRNNRALAETHGQLEESRDVAVRASRAKSEFLANMSHEIRTPMNAIIGLAYLLEQTSLTPVQRDYVHKTQLSAQSLLGILNDVLDLSKIEAGRLELEALPFRLTDLMKTLSVITAANARDKNIEVLIRIAPETPDALVGDVLRLQQVLLNLAGNAIKFTDTGEVVLGVEPVGTGEGTVRLAFSVRDTGIGIAPEQMDTIFEAFTQADASTTRQYGGTGLGLSISRRLVALMGGEISAVSQPGRGSTFSFTAGFALGAGEESVLAPSPELARPLRVLVVDDNPTARDVITTMVIQFGWRVTVAASGREALVAIDRSVAIGPPFELVLLDWAMPEVGGKEVLEHLHRHYPAEALPVVLVVTAFEHDQVRREAGPDRFIRAVLTKPVTPSVLLDAVSSICSTGSAFEPVNQDALAGSTLLLVEDNRINQMISRRIFESAGAIVEVVSSGAEALVALAGGRRFDAVLMDIQMPGMDGYETTRRLRRQPGLAELPVIAMTANALPSDRDRCFAAGMNDHIAKPLDVDRAIQTIRHHLDRMPPAEVPAETPAAPPLAPPQEPPQELDVELALSRCDGDRELLRQIVREFVIQFSEDPQRLTLLLERGELAQVGRKAHELKGVVGNICGPGLAKGASRLQSAAERGELEPAREAGREVCLGLSALLASCALWLSGEDGEGPGAPSGA